MTDSAADHKVINLGAEMDLEVEEEANALEDHHANVFGTLLLSEVANDDRELGGIIFLL